MTPPDLEDGCLGCLIFFVGFLILLGIDTYLNVRYNGWGHR